MFDNSPSGLSQDGYSLAGRQVSGFPLSLPTGLAIESCFETTLPVYDPQRPLPPPIPLSRYDELWFNLATLYRNMVGSMKNEGFINSSPADFKDAMLGEIEVLTSLLRSDVEGSLIPKFYDCNYDKVIRSAPEQIKFRKDKTPKQLEYAKKYDDMLKLLHKETDQIADFKGELRPRERSKTLIMTHIPYDLLSFRNFDKLSLLESHTGKKKERGEWNTKYYPVGDMDLSHMPFNRKLLLIFGDRVMIQPSVYALRKQIVEVGEKRQWTSLTSDEKMMMDLSLEIKEPYVLSFLKAL